MSRYLGDDFLLPNLTPNNEAFFTTGSIMIQKCQDCGHFQHPPDDICYACQGWNLEFVACEGTGVVESCARVHHPLHPALKDKIPYVIAIISVDGATGCNVQGNVVNCAAEDVRIGQKVRAIYEEVDDPQTGTKLKIPQWEPVD